jgi:hypothetical protein
MSCQGRAPSGTSPEIAWVCRTAACMVSVSFDAGFASSPDFSWVSREEDLRGGWGPAGLEMPTNGLPLPPA